MAGFLGAGTLLFVLLLGTSHSSPVKKVPGGSQNTVPQTNTAGGGYSGYWPVNPGQWGQGGGGASPGMGYHYSDVPKVPSSSFRSSPGAGGGPGLVAGAPLMGNMGPAATQDVEWLMSPTRPLSDTDDGGAAGPGAGGMGDGGMGAGGPGSGGPGAGGFGGGGAGGQGPNDAGGAGPLGLMYQPGELSHMANTFEHGNYDTESETQGARPGQPGGSGQLATLPLLLPGYGVGLGPGGGPGLGQGDGAFGPHHGYYWYPYYDFLFLTGQYPPGTVSHFSSNFEQGKDYWHDAHYNKYFYNVGDDSGQQKKTFPGGQYPGNPKKQTGQA